MDGHATWIYRAHRHAEGGRSIDGRGWRLSCGEASRRTNLVVNRLRIMICAAAVHQLQTGHESEVGTVYPTEPAASEVPTDLPSTMQYVPERSIAVRIQPPFGPLAGA